jgi:hypothetical protein
MSHTSHRLAVISGLLFIFCTVGAARADQDDPPERVARLSQYDGDVSYSPAGEDDWVEAAVNRPLVRGDRLWTERNARAELQVGSAAIRLDENTSFEILDLDDRIAQVQVTQGTINLSVRRLYPDQTYEIDTPTLAFNIDRPGRYRIDVAPDGSDTTIVVWEGAGEAAGNHATFPLRAGDAVLFRDTALRNYEEFDLPRLDDFDRYCLDRDQRLVRSPSLNYVGDDVVGYSDLDDYGSWAQEATYGWTWFPSHVVTSWAPYSDGRWVWIEPWGWTWVDNARWGFAPSHYGRWVSVNHRWGWVPGPRHERPIYCPALVAFVGGQGWSVTVSAGSTPVGWFPLAPREVYVPSYRASRNYFTRVNTTNTVINNTTVVNVYDKYSKGKFDLNQVKYSNRLIAGAITAVSSKAFVNAQPVHQSAIRVDRRASKTGRLSDVAPFAPNTRSVAGTGAAPPAASKPQVVPPKREVPAPTLQKEVPAPTRQAPTPQKEVPAPTRQVPAPQKEMPAPTREVPTPQREVAAPKREVIERPVVVRREPPPRTVPFVVREPQLQRNPGRALEPKQTEALRTPERDKPRNVRTIGAQSPSVDTRAAGAAPGEKKQKPRQPLEREQKK